MTNRKYIKIGAKRVGLGEPAFVVAEVAQAHDGSLGLAHSYIDSAYKAGADAIKFQTHIAKAESTREEQFRTSFSYQDGSRYEYWQRMEFNPEQWGGLADHASKLGLIFLSSPFSLEAVDLLEKLGIPAWKVGSGEVNNPYILDAMMRSNKPLLLSTGMSDWDEIEAAVNRIQKQGSPLALLQCTSRYPTELNEIGLNVIDEMRERYGVPIGLSDHSGNIYPSLAAMARGVNIVEVHITFNKEMFGPDTVASVTVDELHLITNARDAFHQMLTHPVDKDVMRRELAPIRKLFGKSVALNDEYPAGTILTGEMLTVKKPGTGIPAQDLHRCIGQRLKCDVSPEQVLGWNDLEETD